METENIIVPVYAQTESNRARTEYGLRVGETTLYLKDSVYDVLSRLKRSSAFLFREGKHTLYRGGDAICLMAGIHRDKSLEQLLPWEYSLNEVIAVNKEERRRRELIGVYRSFDGRGSAKAMSIERENPLGTKTIADYLGFKPQRISLREITGVGVDKEGIERKYI